MKCRKELKEYIESTILPMYDGLDKGHGIEHIRYVIRRSINFAKQVNADEELAYVIAVYHDIGNLVDRKHHEIMSGKIVREDAKLQQFFGCDTIELIAQAVEDHRASAGRIPRSIYGKIVSSADRNVDFNAAIERAYEFRHKMIPEIGLEAAMEDARIHLLSKYGPDGYASKAIYFDDLEYNAMLVDAFAVLSDSETFRHRYIEVIDSLH